MRWLMVCVVTLVLSAALSAQTAQPSPEKVDRVFSAFDKPGSPGCALGVIRDGQFAYRKGYGVGSIELGVPLSSQSVFYMGSVSKQFTAASVVLAAEQGFLSLDDDVRKYVPELPDYGHKITLRQMLHHSSGLRDDLTLMFLAGKHDQDMHSEQEFIELIVRQKGLNNVPGDEYLYSNSNYFLAGVVLKRATKKSLAEFAAENIFEPLGMTHTRFYDDHSVVVPNRVAAYDPSEGRRFVVDWSTNFDSVGAGGLMSSVDDVLLWDRNFYQNKLGKGTLLNELQRRGVLNNGKQISYALGLEMSTYRGLPVVDHGGALFGYRTHILRFPEQNFTVVCLCNLSTAAPEMLARQVADIYLDKEMLGEANGGAGAAAVSGGADLPDPALFAGKYFDRKKRAIYDFTASDGQLMAWGARLQRIGRNQFRDLGTGIITFEGSGNAAKVELDLDANPFFIGDRIEEPKPSAEELAAFAGRYTSDELDATYVLSVDLGSLMLRVGWNPAVKLTPIALDAFDGGDFGTIEFQRDGKHRVSGLKVFDLRARGIVFEKTRQAANDALRSAPK